MLPGYVKLKDIKPALGGYIREAYSMLSSEIVPDEKTVHDVRVLMKKSRAVLKLMENQIDKDTFVREYRTYREVGRQMGAWRETSVHRKILKSIRKNYPDLFPYLADIDKISQILKKAGTVKQESPETSARIEYIRELLSKSGYRLRFMNLNNIDPNLLLKELEITYNSVSESYLAARNNPKPALQHEFRKRTKDFLYQLYFFRSLKTKVIRDLEKRLDSLTQNLGKYNDRAVLIKSLDYRCTGKSNNSALDELIVIIRNEQDRYLMKVWPAAYRIFCPGRELANLLGYKVLVL